MQVVSNDRTYLETLEAEKSRVIDRLVASFALALLPLSVVVVYFAIRSGWGVISQLQLVAIFLIWVLALNRRRFNSGQLGIILTALMLGGALGEVLRFGLISPTFPLLAVLPVVAAAIAGVRWGIFGLGIVCLAVIAFAWLMMATEPVPPVDLNVFIFDIENWVVLIVNIVVASGIGLFVVGSLYNFHMNANSKLRKRNHELARSQLRNMQSGKLAGLGHAVSNQTTGQVLECDASYAEMHGLTVKEFTSLDIGSDIIAKLVYENDRDAALAVKQRLLNGEVVISELRHNLPNGEIRHLRKTFAPIHSSDETDAVFDVISQDVSRERQLQDKLYQAQKMDAIGKLTGGIAHDFNNLLAVILGNQELLDDEITDPDQKELIRNTVEAAQRGAELTRNMLSFARQAPLAPTNVDLNQLVRNMRTWIGRTLPSTIEVETSLLAGLWPVKVDASSAESGLLNLILNARDAMAESGKLTIETCNVRIDEEYVELRGEEIDPGRYVLLAVSDTGEGILPENMAKIFEPFFTTKPVGSGSGLGLSMLEGFMKQSGGTARVYSEPGVGTTFKLYFAASSDAPVQNSSAPRLMEPNGDDKNATILLVEDNVKVLETIRAALQRTGYRVLTAISGDAAREAFEQEPEIDLLLTDIVMPGELQGTTLARALRDLRPDLPVVFMSGYAREATVHGNGLRPEDIRLMKPVRREDLLRAVEKALLQRDAGYIKK